MSGPPPRPADDAELAFRRKKPVRWFSPKVLLSTGQRVVLSSAMGDFLDKRELQRSVTPLTIDHGGGDEAWIDYVADTGDGFNPTYSIAWLTAQRQLALPELDIVLPRPDLLVLGGDEVYPSAAPDEYDNRFRGPYMAALPYKRTDNPKLLAIPGNHDWYDGLTNFMRLFSPTGGTWIGGRKTCQTHSYFAVRLPQNWWLWGIDIQFDAFIDDPQIQFFKGVAEAMGDQRGRIILCTGKPSWADVKSDPDAFRNLGHFHKRTIAPFNADLLLSISGDSHHYARYQGADGTQRITAGGGGAFLHPTHHLDAVLDIPVGPGRDEVQRYDLQCLYPDRRRSRRLSAGALELPLRSRTFILVPAVIYLILGWATQFAVRVLEPRLVRPVDQAARSFGWADLLGGLFRNPVSVLVLLIVLGGLIGFAKPSADWSSGFKKILAKMFLGSVHFIAQVAVGVLFVGPVAIKAASWADGFLFSAVALVVLAVLGGLTAAFTMGAYLAVCCAFLRTHGNEAFSARANIDYKNFLRLHIDGDGVLTVYPVALDRSTRKWEFDPQDLDEEASWLKPGPGVTPKPRLVEPPITIEPSAGNPVLS